LGDSASPDFHSYRFERQIVTIAEVKDSCLREIEVEVPAEEVARQTERVIQQLQKMARLPGFRRGHVPASIIRQRFAEEIKSEVVEKLVPQFFQREAEKQHLIPVSQPRVTDLHLHDGEALRFKASFEVMPEIKVEGYKELRADRPEIAVTDEEVEDAIQQLREQHASFTPVEGRALADGDFASVSLEGAPKEGEGKPVSMGDVLVEIGGKNTLEEFSINLRGASVGDERSFDVTYPQDFSDSRLAGSTVSYKVRVQGIKQKNTPGLDDAFVQQLGENFKTVDDFKTEVRSRIEQNKRLSAEREAKDKLLAELVKRHDFPVPDALVERQIDLRLDRGLRALAAQGMRTEDMRKMDFDRLRAGQRDQAVHDVKASLLLSRIAEAENIQVSDEEIDKEVEALAAQSNQPVEAIRARLTRDGALDRIRGRIRNDKTLDFLYRQTA
jgi:trigger factor